MTTHEHRCPTNSVGDKIFWKGWHQMVWWQGTERNWVDEASENGRGSGNGVFYWFTQLKSFCVIQIVTDSTVTYSKGPNDVSLPLSVPSLRSLFLFVSLLTRLSPGECKVFAQCLYVHAQSLSHVWLFVTPRTVAHQAPLSMGFSRQEYCSELPFPPPGDLADPETKSASLTSPALARGFFMTILLGQPADLHRPSCIWSESISFHVTVAIPG